MNVLLDSCMWGNPKSVIAAGRHEVEWVGDWSVDPGDEQILAHAAADRRVLVTIDKDFGELAVVRGVPHAGIIRVVGFATRDQGPACVAALARYGEELQAGALVTVEQARIRIRPADQSSG